jgi:2-polyprenyl-3-methyl-5-hydroxy-6-metoxy-1,4-benzoquinol methylase
MITIQCNQCKHDSFTHLFNKESSLNEVFSVVRCHRCGLVMVNPQPTFGEIAKYYSNEYFTKRTDRGYDNYYSEKIQKEISRVFQMNLSDLHFFEWEAGLPSSKSTMDIGCAAGYFVNFMKNRGWAATGIEIAQGPVEFARNVLSLDVIQSDFLQWDTESKTKFDLITLWASLEHLHQPKETLQKIYKHLKPGGGRLILSTCRYGILAILQGKSWRFMNVPEHLFYYSLSGIIQQCKEIGFQKISHITYGSGMTTKKDAGLFYEVMKNYADTWVKFTDQGDMMALVFEVA